MQRLSGSFWSRVTWSAQLGGLEEKTADQITRSFIETFNLRKTQVERKIKTKERSVTDSTGLWEGGVANTGIAIMKKEKTIEAETLESTHGRHSLSNSHHQSPDNGSALGGGAVTSTSKEELSWLPRESSGLLGKFFMLLARLPHGSSTWCLFKPGHTPSKRSLRAFSCKPRQTLRHWPHLKFGYPNSPPKLQFSQST